MWHTPSSLFLCVRCIKILSNSSLGESLSSMEWITKISLELRLHLHPFWGASTLSRLQQRDTGCPCQCRWRPGWAPDVWEVPGVFDVWQRLARALPPLLNLSPMAPSLVGDRTLGWKSLDYRGLHLRPAEGKKLSSKGKMCFLESSDLWRSHLLRHRPIPALNEGRSLKLNVGALAEGHAVCDTTKNFGPATTFEIDFCKMVFKINTYSPRFRW